MSGEGEGESRQDTRRPSSRRSHSRPSRPSNIQRVNNSTWRPPTPMPPPPPPPSPGPLRPISPRFPAPPGPMYPLRPPLQPPQASPLPVHEPLYYNSMLDQVWGQPCWTRYPQVTYYNRRGTGCFHPQGARIGPTTVQGAPSLAAPGTRTVHPPGGPTEPTTDSMTVTGSSLPEEGALSDSMTEVILRALGMEEISISTGENSAERTQTPPPHGAEAEPDLSTGPSDFLLRRGPRRRLPSFEAITRSQDPMPTLEDAEQPEEKSLQETEEASVHDKDDSLEELGKPIMSLLFDEETEHQEPTE